MVAHQYVGMQGTAVPEQCFFQALQITLPILVIEEARQAVVATLDHMLRHAGKVGAWKSSHGDTSLDASRPGHRQLGAPAVRIARKLLSESVSDTVSPEDVIPNAEKVLKPEFSGDWNNYTTHGIADSPLASPEGIRLVNELEPLSYDRRSAILRAEDLMASGSTLPYANPIEVGDVFYKLVPEGGTVGAKSPYWFTESQLAPLRDLPYDQIADRLGLPLASQQGSSFSLVSIRATSPGISFTSRIAPTTELGAGGILWQQSGNAQQTLLINRSLFTAPQVVKPTFP